MKVEKTIQQSQQDSTYYMTVRMTREELEQIDGMREEYKKACFASLSRHAAVKLLIERGFLEVMETVIGPMFKLSPK
jgi:hypothetical protein